MRFVLAHTEPCFYLITETYDRSVGPKRAPVLTVDLTLVDHEDNEFEYVPLEDGWFSVDLCLN